MLKIEEFYGGGIQGLGKPVTCNLDYVFKAKMVTFWEVSRLFAEICILRGILLFSVKSCTLPVLGPQKTSQKLMLIKGFEQGTHKVAFGAQKCTFWHSDALFRKNSYFWCQWLEKAAEL